MAIEDLIAEVEAQTAREVEEIRAGAILEAEQIVSQARRDLEVRERQATEQRREELQKTQLAALRRARDEARATVLRARDEALEVVISAARKLLEQVDPNSISDDTLARWLGETLECVGPERAILRAPPQLADRLRKLAPKDNLEIVPDPEAKPAFVLATSDGRVTVDARLTTLLATRSAELAPEILHLLEERCRSRRQH